MKRRICSVLSAFAVLAMLLTVNLQLSTLHAQGTAFTYQGQLLTTNGPAHGTYNLQFVLYTNSTGGTSIAGPVTTNGVVITNGLFTVVINFGAGVFTGPTNWLQIGVESNGVGTFTTLTPRQQLTPTPYAIYAESADAAGITGTIPAGDLTGVYGGGLTGVAVLSGANTFSGNETVDGMLTISDGGFSDSTFTDLIIGPGGYDDGEQHSINFNDSAGHIGSLIVGFNGGGYFSVGNLWYDGVHPTNTTAFTVFGTGNVNIDPEGLNSGYLNNGNTNGSGITFGISSGEGIASQRLVGAGANQYGLDFYTDFTKRMSITQSGFVGIGTQTPVNPSDTQFGLYSPTTNGYDGMWIETGVGGLPFYGYSEGGAFSAYSWVDGSDANKWKLWNGSGTWLTVTTSGDVGIDTTTPSENLEINGTSRIDNYDIYMRAAGDYNHGLGYREYVDGGGFYVDGPFLYGYNGGSLGTSDPDTATLFWNYLGDVWVSNNCSVASLTIRGGADLAEPFRISSLRKEIPKGSVVVIDEKNPGQLKISDRPYDTRVAGVLSGANGVNPGIQMQQQGLIEGDRNVALSGRVYVLADTANGAIQPGDLLTTSARPGYAMRVTNHAKAEGAILGKAMTGLGKGQGTVLVLVTLQ